MTGGDLKRKDTHGNGTNEIFVLRVRKVSSHFVLTSQFSSLSLQGPGLRAPGSPDFTYALLLLVSFGSSCFTEAVSTLLKSSFFSAVYSELVFVLSHPQPLHGSRLAQKPACIFSVPSHHPLQFVLPEDGLSQGCLHVNRVSSHSHTDTENTFSSSVSAVSMNLPSRHCHRRELEAVPSTLNKIWRPHVKGSPEASLCWGGPAFIHHTAPSQCAAGFWSQMDLNSNSSSCKAQ